MYRRMSLLFALILMLALTSHLASSDRDDVESNRQGVLSVLREGQAVSLRTVGDRYDVSFFEAGEGPLGHRVMKVGEDYLVVEDLARVTETRIPIWSIKSVTIIKTGAPGR
jgi:hypothetical protein